MSPWSLGPTVSTSIVIVNYNTCALLDRLLESLRLNEYDEIVVVDNASTDGSPDLVLTRYPDVTLIANSHNSGYGSAANQGIRHSCGEVVVLLNSDTILEPDAVQALTSYLLEHPVVAIVGPVLVGIDGTLQRSWRLFPSIKNVVLQEIGLRRYIRRHPIKRLRRPYEPRASGGTPVDWVVGAALAIRRAAFDEVGGFDESYFMYFEEVDLCKRLRDAGWEVHYAPVTNVVHVGGASTIMQRSEMLAQFVTSKRKYVREHHAHIPRVLLLAAIELGLLRRLIRDAYMRLRSPDDEERRWLSEACRVRWRLLRSR